MKHFYDDWPLQNESGQSALKLAELKEHRGVLNHFNPPAPVQDANHNNAPPALPFNPPAPQQPLVENANHHQAQLEALQHHHQAQLELLELLELPDDLDDEDLPIMNIPNLPDLP